MAREALISLSLILALAATACSTTGDPNSGGLFTWREQQAQERQENLHRDIEATEASIRQHTEEYDYLKGTKTDVTERVAELEQVFRVLVAENADLKVRIQTLIAQENTAQSQLAQLRAALPGLPAPEEFAGLESETEQQEWVARLRQQNLRMRQALDF